MSPLVRITRLAVILTSLSATSAHAQWPPHGAPVSTSPNDQDQVSAVSDGAGGMIIAWRDRRSDDGDIYVQRVTGRGVAVWAPGGVAVCTAANQQRLPQIVTDGAGGAILAWQDNRVDPMGDIYAQRVGAGGMPLWVPNGVPLITGASENVQTVSRFRMIPDGVGGAILTFSDNRLSLGGLDPGIPKVWAERVTAFGSPLWSPGGVPVAAGLGSYENASVAPDGRGGILVAWSDNTSGDWNIGANHVNQGGVLQWGTGVILCGATDDQLFPEVVPDGAGGAIVAWQDNRSDPGGDIYGQRIDRSGAPQWMPDGNVLVSGPSANNAGDYIIRMIQDGTDGVILAFSDDRNSAGVPDPGAPKVWAQRIDYGGIPLWLNGVPVAAGPGTHKVHRILTDTEGGAIVAWEDGSAATNSNIFAQRLEPTSGSPRWGPGVSVCSALGLQAAPAAVADGLGGVLSAWADLRSGVSDVYAQYVDFTGVPAGSPRWECRSWHPDGLLVGANANLQGDAAIAPDGAGGAIIVWRDERADTGDVYIQRVASFGAPLWTPGGVPICVKPGLQREPRIVSDGKGGAIIAWQDNRDGDGGDLYAQRIDPNGNVLWAVSGVPIVAGPWNNEQSQMTFRAVSDGVGGAIFTFQDSRRPDGVDIYPVWHVRAQRVDGNGIVLWGSGVPVCTSPNEARFAVSVSDGAGGVIVAWEQHVVASTDVVAQRLDADGNMLWGSSIVVSGAPDWQAFAEVTSDGAGGAIVSWIDTRIDGWGDIYAQKLNPLGGALWAADGVPLVTGPARHAPLFPGLNEFISMIPDNEGGAFLAFIDSRSAAGFDTGVPMIWAQQVKASGFPGWGNGVPVGTAGLGARLNPSIVSDSEGGSVIVWQDRPGPQWDIKAQRLSAGGGAHWVTGGVVVCDEIGDQTRPAVTFDGRGHAIAAWTDARGDAGDVYAERICVAGVSSTTGVEPRVAAAPEILAAPAPNPAGGALTYTVSLREPGRVRVVLADVRGRSVATLLDRDLERGAHTYRWGLRSGAERVAAGVYFLVATTAEGRATRKVVVLR